MFKIDISDIWHKRFIVCWDFFPKVPHFISFTFWAGAVWENSFFTAEVEIPMHFCPWTNSITHVKVKYWHFPLQNNVIFQTCFVKKRILKCWGGSLKRQDRQMIQGINYTTYSVWCSANCEEEEKAHWKMLWDTPPGGALPLEDSKHKLTKLGRCNSWRIELLSNGNARLAIKDWKKQRARYNCKEIWIGWKFSQVIGTARNCLVGSRGTSKYQNQNLEQPHRRLIDWLMIDYVKTDLLW